MRIAQVSPLYESVPPKSYGGTERIVSYITEELVARGHDVTLFASGDSETQARLIPACSTSVRLSNTHDKFCPHILLLEHVWRRAKQFDVIHYHIDYLHFVTSRRMGVPHVTTLHGRLDLPELGPVYDEFDDAPVVSISDAQRQPLPQARWVKTVYHGLPRSLLQFSPGPGEYLAFLGRISREKRLDRAIEIARALDLPLKVAAKIDNADREYFESEIKHLMNDPHVEFVGEIGDAEKQEFLGRAKALLFPIDWPEPFGLVMIEAMACGTPVIAFANGSVPEVIDDGVTGFVVNDIEGAIRATAKVDSLDRRRIRATFEQRFSVEKMVDGYLAVYKALLGPSMPVDKRPSMQLVPLSAE